LVPYPEAVLGPDPFNGLDEPLDLPSYHDIEGFDPSRADQKEKAQVLTFEQKSACFNSLMTQQQHQLHKSKGQHG